MAQCSNCKARLSCGCQRRTAADGKSVCTKCIADYNKTKVAPVRKNRFTPPTTPSNVKATYKPNR